VFGLAALIAAFSFVVGAAQPQDPIWRKAVETAQRTKPWIPGGAVFSIEVTDGGGKLTDSYVSRYRIAPDAQGKPLMHVESALRNGKDVTETERESQEKRNLDAAGKPGASPLSMGDNPFDPAIQDSIDARPTGETRTIGGRVCVVYGFSMKRKTGEMLTGTAVLDRETGAPVEADYTQKPLPFGVQSMNMTLKYGNGPLGGGFLTEVGIEGSGGILFIKRGFHSVISLDGYWKSEVPLS
jgi:hypothetical protein